MSSNEIIRGEELLQATAPFRRIIMECIAAASSANPGWPAEAELDSSGSWLIVQHPDVQLPDQGWKLHVSASTNHAAVALERALPILLAEPSAFKVASCVDMLNTLNHGQRSLSQIGKFITVYPEDDAQAVRLAVALDEATKGIPGPDIPSDRPLHPGSRVHYRYAASGAVKLQNKVGEIFPAMRAPDGAVIPDIRRPTYQPPAWAVDPFLRAGVASEMPDRSPLIGDRYLVVAPLHHTARGGIYAALDIEQPRYCIVKQAPVSPQIGVPGREPCDHLRNEADALRRLSPDAAFPDVIDVVEDEIDLFLVIEWLPGETLEQRILRLALLGETVPAALALSWARQLAALLMKIHGAGLVYRDLKSTNILVDDDDTLHLIDFELACDQGDPGMVGLGTRGYVSPQQYAGEPASILDDVYGYGAILMFIATGAEPSRAPAQFDLLSRPLTLLNPGINTGIVDVISRCLQADPAHRFVSMQAVDDALAEIAWDTALVHRKVSASKNGAQTDYGPLARRFGDTLCAVAEHAVEGGVAWASRHPLTSGMYARDINTGAAGTLLALAELYATFDDPSHRQTLMDGARWLAKAPKPEGDPLPGLYVGEAGVGAALLRVGQVLDSDDLIAAALQRGIHTSLLPHESPDLFNGSAGRLRFHLFLWAETRERVHLDAAEAAATYLLETATVDPHGGVFWTIPNGFGALSEQAYFGYAHGAAGVADALLDLYDETGNPELLNAARGVARWLIDNASPCLDDRSGLSWPSTLSDENLAGAYWCHGAGGISLFFLHATALKLLPEAHDVATRSLRTVAHAARWAQPTLCHGLAGNTEILLTAYQMTGDEQYLSDALTLAELLKSFVVEVDGLVFCSSEEPTLLTPDYLVGYAGAATAFLRLAFPDRPHVLSRSSFLQSARRHPTRMMASSHTTDI